MTALPLPPPEEALRRSAVRPRFPIGAVVVLLGSMVAVGLFLAPAAEGPARALQLAVALLVPLGALVYATVWGAQMSAELRRERQEVDLALLAEAFGRLPDAEVLVCKLLSRPMLSPMNRVHALWVYVALLMRRGRFSDVGVVVDQLLTEGVPVHVVATLRAAKAYSLLREDRLVDADRAMGELRRDDVAGDGLSEALFRLLSLARDVSTGHPEEALSTHETHRYGVIEKLGTRGVASADALASAAAHRLGRTDVAGRLWQRATTLESPAELLMKYPVLGEVAGRYPAATVPAELAEAFAVTPLAEVKA